MKKKIDLSSWNRKDHFNFFKEFEEPFHGVCVKINCEKAYQKAKFQQVSFYYYYLYRVLKAINLTPALRLRILDGEPWEFEKIHVSPTVARADGSFGFSFMEFSEHEDHFRQNAIEATKVTQSTSELFTFPFREDVIHFSALPWLDFTSLSHSRKYSIADSCPKVSIGKMTIGLEGRSFPLSIHVHHALADGRDVGLFVQNFQQLMEE
ncbi:chloramphenicol acetyltransferase [Litoribacter ruber]|uniref:CatA-like O-acetyltransferase n=1 Tax=Litoribacter ruber TaxID=702568 RepID=UPI001BD9F226|nr:CatA-like O-acetyltransferase [Litoribacter ruber]MBT0811152.1 chloramphenicol acetyltransferase [Litoribacter ruber]